MGFLRRLLGSEEPATASTTVEAVDPDVAERERELDLLREEQDRLDDLTIRQLRYAAYAWEPPAQGGERRADDGDDVPS